VIVVGGGALLLVPLSQALIFGAFGYQGLGPSGGAVAMLVYYGLGTLAYTAYLWGGFGVLKPSFRIPRLLWRQRSPFSVSAACRPSSRRPRI
jgi:Na+-driven multidrug efflux pump